MSLVSRGRTRALIASLAWTALVLPVSVAQSGETSPASAPSTTPSTAAPSRQADEEWVVASRKATRGREWSVYVEAEKRPGSPAFRIETRFPVSPVAAAATLMDGMMNSNTPTTPGETRRILERSADGALVHTLVDLPFMFDDREVAIRVAHTVDDATGVHRVAWVDENDVLPPAKKGVLRLATEGYWEFRPAELGETHAIYVSRAEVGGSLPGPLADRLMKGQAEKAVERLSHSIRERGRTHVAGPPPFEGLAREAAAAASADALAPVDPKADPAVEEDVRAD